MLKKNIDRLKVYLKEKYGATLLSLVAKSTYQAFGDGLSGKGIHTTTVILRVWCVDVHNSSALKEAERLVFSTEDFNDAPFIRQHSKGALDESLGLYVLELHYLVEVLAS
jgi:hypothetical protein